MIHPLALQVLRQLKKWLVLLGTSCTVTSLAMVAQAWFFAQVMTDCVFYDQSAAMKVPSIIGFLVALAVRLMATYGQERWSQALGSRSVALLRQRIMPHMIEQGIEPPESQGNTVHLLTDGLNQVEAYIARYVPQMMYAVIMPLIMGIAIIDSAYWIGVILLVTVPLIPFFMILIGKQAESMNRQQWERMSFLSGHFLDVLQGLSTLQLLGRSKEQLAVIARLSGEFRDSTLRVLRVAFLSALVLELVSTISTALIAVYLGVTLLYGYIDFFSAFFILLLAPDFYAPFRQLGAAFHTGMAGKTSLIKLAEYLATEGKLLSGGTVQLTEPINTIEFRHADYQYHTGGAVLHDIDLTIRGEDRIMLVGESGAGKTTLAHIVAGFLTPPRNRVFVNGIDLHDLHMEWWRSQIVYVSQRPYIFSGTLRDAIRFGMDASDEEILHACQQAEVYDVVMQKPGGLDYCVGDGGEGLSGGEKQRIALARAFLREGSVLILDEVTAHLDVKTESLLRVALERLMAHKTVILIGHRLQTMEWANTLYIMRHGRIVEHGAYENLVNQGGYFASLVHAGSGRIQWALPENKERPQTERTAVTHPVPDITDVPTSGQAKWSLLFSVLSPARWSLVLALVFAFLTVFMNVGLLSTSAWLLTSAGWHPELVYLGLAIVGVRFFGISRAVCRYFERLTSHRMAFQGLYGLRVWLYSVIEPLGPSLLGRLGAGNILARIMADIETLQFFYLRVLIPPVGAVLLTLCLVVGVSYFSHVLMVPIIMACLIGMIGIPWYVFHYTRQSVTQVAQLESTIKDYASSMLSGLGDIIAYSEVNHALSRLQGYFAQSHQEKANIQEYTNRGNILFIALMHTTVLIVTLWANDYIDGPWYSAWVAAIALGVLAWFEALQPMTIAWHHGYESSVAAGRLQDMKEMPVAVTDGEIQSIRNGDITFTDVSFSYGQQRLALQLLQLTIREGEHVAIVGASGSGKSTIFKLLERFYDYRGSITVGNQELRAFHIETWRSWLGVVSQDTYIFHATLEDNIRMAKPHCSADELRAACKWAKLDDVVNRIGLDTYVGHGGVGLSGGEKQRIALARLYLQNAPIMLLDEPLEGLDPVTRRDIHRALMEHMEGKTGLYITHQLEGLEEMDRILFLQDGQIVEDGTYGELMARRGLFYEYAYLSMASV